MLLRVKQESGIGADDAFGLAEDVFALSTAVVGDLSSSSSLRSQSSSTNESLTVYSSFSAQLRLAAIKLVAAVTSCLEEDGTCRVVMSSSLQRFIESASLMDDSAQVRPVSSSNLAETTYLSEKLRRESWRKNSCTDIFLIFSHSKVRQLAQALIETLPPRPHA